MLSGNLYKMMTRRLLTYCCCLVLLTSTSSWAVSEPGAAPIAQPDPAKTGTDKPVPAPPPTEKLEPLPSTQGKPPQKPIATPQVPITSVKPPLTPNTPANNTPALVMPAGPAVKSLPLRTPAPQRVESVQSAPVPAPVLVQPQISYKGTDSNTLDIEIFDREDCLQCDKAREFFTRLKTIHPQLKIITRDVRKEPAALQLLKRMAQNQGKAELDYPAFVVGGQLIIGFSEEAGTAQLILDTLAASRPENQQEKKDLLNCKSGNEPGCALIPSTPYAKPQHIIFNVMGYNIQLVQISLPLFTIVMGLLDGLNYSSLWILMLIISMLAPAKNRRLMFTIAATFVAVQGLIYFILMAVWFNLITQIDISRLTQILFAILALLAGTIYLKKYLFFGQSISIASNEINKPGIYTRIRQISESKNLTIAFLGTIVLATLVQFSEFSYTSAFPALYTRVLHLQHLGNLSNYGYLLLYDFAYMLDDLIVLTLGLITLNSISLRKFNPRILMLLSGLVAMALAAYLILVKP